MPVSCPASIAPPPAPRPSIPASGVDPPLPPNPPPAPLGSPPLPSDPASPEPADPTSLPPEPVGEPVVVKLPLPVLLVVEVVVPRVTPAEPPPARSFTMPVLSTTATHAVARKIIPPIRADRFIALRGTVEARVSKRWGAGEYWPEPPRIVAQTSFFSMLHVGNDRQ